MTTILVGASNTLSIPGYLSEKTFVPVQSSMFFTQLIWIKAPTDVYNMNSNKTILEERSKSIETSAGFLWNDWTGSNKLFTT